MFIILLNYTGTLEEIDALVPAHRMFLNKYYILNKFICSGAQIPRTGGVILCNAASKDEVKQIIAEDPFHIHSVAKYNIIEFTPSKYAGAFEPFIF